MNAAVYHQRLLATYRLCLDQWSQHRWVSSAVFVCHTVSTCCCQLAPRRSANTRWCGGGISSSPGGMGRPSLPRSLFEIWKGIIKKHSKHTPTDRLCSLVLCKAGTFIWKPVHESVMNRFHFKGVMKNGSCF